MTSSRVLDIEFIIHVWNENVDFVYFLIQYHCSEIKYRVGSRVHMFSASQPRPGEGVEIDNFISQTFILFYIFGVGQHR